MAKGFKTGGRVAGTPNKRTVDVIEKLEALDCDPISAMARIAMDATNPPELRGRLLAELAQYVAPKRRSLDMSAQSAAPISIRIGIPAKSSDAESIETRPD